MHAIPDWAQDVYRAKEKLMAYVLYYEFGYTKASIAQLMKLSPQQMGAWIKEISLLKRIYDLDRELQDTKEKLQSVGYYPQVPLNVLPSFDDEDF